MIEDIIFINYIMNINYRNSFNELKINELKNNKIMDDNMYENILNKFKKNHDDIFIISKNIETFEKKQSLKSDCSDEIYKNYYKNNNENITNNFPNLDEEKNISNFYKNMNLNNKEKEYINEIESIIGMKLELFESKINILKDKLINKLKELLELENKILDLCDKYDNNYQMIYKMKEIIGENFSNLTDNLDNYINDFISNNKLHNIIIDYKNLLIECNMLKSCISMYYNSQITKNNIPMCKICWSNISNIVCIPCGHLICKNCLTLVLIPYTEERSYTFLINPLNISNLSNQSNSSNRSNIQEDISERPSEEQYEEERPRNQPPRRNIMPILAERLNNERINDTIIMNTEHQELDDHVENDENDDLDRNIRRSVNLPSNNAIQTIYKPISKCSFCRQNIDRIYKIYLI